MLSFVPTPIGNMGDISFRTLEVLKDTELILCEDTRVTKKLLHLIGSKYELQFPKFQFIALHSHNEKSFLEQSDTKNLLESKNVVYMSDAGMPCISDPGALLVEYCLKYQIEFDVLPGANAILTAYASSGFDTTEFTFFGFLPHKGDERKIKLDKVISNQYVSILYESPHRLLKLLAELNELIPQRELFLVKELTKKFQTRYKDSASKLYNSLKTQEIKGEWVVVIKNDHINSNGIITKKDILSLEIPPKQKAKLLAKITNQSVKEIYQSLISH